MELSVKAISDLTDHIKDLAVAGSLIMKGEIEGYQVTCLNCGTASEALFKDFKFDEEVECPNCKTKYLQRNNISGILTRKNIGEY